MRTIYAIQLMPKVGQDLPASAVFGQLVDKVCSWVERKYERTWNTQLMVSRDGASVAPLADHEMKTIRRGVEGGELFELEWHHPHDDDASVKWATTCLVARSGAELQFTLLIRITTDRLDLRPVRYDLGRPRIVSDVLESYPATVDRWPVPLDVNRLAAGEVQPYVDVVLMNRARSLPVVMVSPDLWGGRYSVDPAQLLQALKGYAHVAVLEDKWAAFKLTGALDREFACYDGSVRIYWPGLRLIDSPYQHKLFLRNTRSISSMNGANRSIGTSFASSRRSPHTSTSRAPSSARSGLRSRRRTPPTSRVCVSRSRRESSPKKSSKISCSKPCARSTRSQTNGTG
jgi:hypothetical protein